MIRLDSASRFSGKIGRAFWRRVAPSLHPRTDAALAAAFTDVLVVGERLYALPCTQKLAGLFGCTTHINRHRRHRACVAVDVDIDDLSSLGHRRRRCLQSVDTGQGPTGIDPVELTDRDSYAVDTRPRR